MKKQIFGKIIEFLPIAIIGALVLSFVIACAGEIGALEDQVKAIESGWRLNGETVETLPIKDVRPPREASILEIIVEEGASASADEAQHIGAGDAICFYSTYQTVEAYLDGDCIYRFVKPERERFIQAAPSIWNTIFLPKDCAGATLRIELSSPYQKYSNRMPEFFAGQPSLINRFVSIKTVPLFVASLSVLVVGLILALIAANVRQYVRGQTGLYSLSLFIIALALFLTGQQTTVLTSIYAGSSYIALQHVSLMMCPILYSWYMMRTGKNKTRRRIAQVILGASLINLLVTVILQLFKVADMPEMLNATRTLCVVLIIYAFVLEIRMQRRLMKLMFIALLAYVLIRFYFTGTITYEVYIGLFGYLYVIVYRVAATLIRTRARHIRLEAELEASRSEIAIMQITSHFFYHTLDSIRALIRLDSDKAYKMTGDFAKYIRHRVDGMDSRQQFVSFSRELRSIRAYVDIKQAQLGDRFKMEFDVETDEFEILALSVQPMVENAVIHAMQLRRDGGVIRLTCCETQSGYHIEVIDNGCGAKPMNSEEHEQKRSIAIENVNKRLEYYGIAPLVFRENELGGMTVSLDMPKKIGRKKDAP